MAQQYEALYQYLEKRYADSVVLIVRPDRGSPLLPLANAARFDKAWWSNSTPDGVQHVQSLAWTRASRTARVNLGARTVLFERNANSRVAPEK